LRAFQEGNSCLLSTGAPDSPVHHRTLSGADFFPILAQPTVEDSESLVRISFLFWRSRPLKIQSRWRTGHCPVHTGQSGAPSDRWLCHASRADYAADCWLTEQSGAPPDSPVIYSRTPPTKPESSQFARASLHHQTVRCTQTAQSLGCPAKSFPN
jgi:hypothetical protein